MTPAQKVAFDSPCFGPEECSQRKFSRRLLFPRDDMTTVLTANVGLE